MIPITNLSLATKIRQVFIDQAEYLIDKNVPEFSLNNKFLGDYYNQIIVEPHGDTPPTFYHTLSPYDVISGKAPQRAIIFRAGEMLLNIDFTEYVVQRTGIMDSVLLKGMGISSLQGKKCLFVGTSKMARASVAGLKDVFPDFTVADAMNASGNIESFSEFAQQLGITINLSSLSNIGLYDFIFCHAKTNSPILTPELRNAIKPHAVITSFATEDNIELADDFYSTQDANVIVDWDKTFSFAKELKEAINKKQAHQEKIITLEELFKKTKMLNPRAKYTVFRSTGTPMQNLAVLKLLMKNT